MSFSSSMEFLATSFFIVACLYAMVGFGGGSSYLALLVLFAVPYHHLPSLALFCNLIVVSGGTYLYWRRGYLRSDLLWPLICGSVPLAYLGGRIPVPRDVFLWMLALALMVAAWRLFAAAQVDEKRPLRQLGWPLALTIGSALGFVSGLVGIGGGIFLAPILLIGRWGKAKEVAGVCSAFILVNSLAGLVGQLSKIQSPMLLLSYWPLAVAVLLGGQLGSRLGTQRISGLWIRNLTAALVMFVALRILTQLVY